MTIYDDIAKHEDRICLAILQAGAIGLRINDLGRRFPIVGSEYFSLRHHNSNLLITVGDINDIEQYLDRFLKLKAFL